MSTAEDFSLSSELSDRFFAINRSQQRAQGAGEDEAVLPPAQHGTMAEYSSRIPTGKGDALNFDWFPFQAPYPESTAGKGLPGLYSDEVAAAKEIAVMKSTQIGCCLDPGTMVLTADLRWVRMDSISPGLEIVGIDEEKCPELGMKGSRRIRRGVVEAVREVREPAYRLTFSDGRTIVATGNHRFFCQREKYTERYFLSAYTDSLGRVSPGRWVSPHPRTSATEEGRGRWAPWEWIEVKDMVPGKSRVRSLFSRSWAPPGYEDGWVAGALDGEGHWGASGNGQKLTFTQRPGPVLDRMREYLVRAGIAFGESSPPNGQHIPCTHLSVGRMSDQLRLVGTVRPSRWICDLDKFLYGRKLPTRGSEKYAELVAVEPVGIRRMIDLQTSCKTYIAGGLVSHNSEWLLRSTIRHVDEFQETAIVAFPTDDTVKDFGRERLEPMIRNSPYLMSRIPKKSIGNAHQKQIGEFGWIYLRGSVQARLDKRSAKAQSTAAQLVVFDEYDELDARTVAQMERRTSGAQQTGHTARFRRVGVPTVDGAGIAAKYAVSDRRRWWVHCKECGEEQVLDWAHNMRWRTRASRDEVCRPGSDIFENPEDVVEAWRVCRACGERIDVANGRWLAEDPEAEVVGFHITRLIVPMVDLVGMVKNSRRTAAHDVEAFFQNDLGTPYTDAATGLPREIVEQRIASGVPMRDAFKVPGVIVTAGIDVASARDMHYRVSALVPDNPEEENTIVRRVCLATGATGSWDRLRDLMSDYSVTLAVIDNMPERTMAYSFAADFPGRVVLAIFDERHDSEPVVYKRDKNMVSVNKGDTLDAVVAAIRDGRNVLPSNPPPYYVEHLTSMRRQRQRNARGHTFYRYITVGDGGERGTDDLLLADAYDLVAKETLTLFDLLGEFEDEEETVIEGQGLSDAYYPGFGAR